jgi:hypothetical protein
MTPSPIEHFVGESHDGSGAGDHDLPLVFGRKSHAVAPLPFSTRELGCLMVLRSRWQTGLLGEDGYVPQVRRLSVLWVADRSEVGLKT